MERHARLSMMLALAAVLAGCCPTLKSLNSMRKITNPKVARKKQKKVLKYFEKKRKKKAIWRAEAMTTMATLDVRFKFGSKGRELHQKLESLLKAEYLKPKTKPKTSSRDNYYLRGWAIYSLGQIDEPKYLDYFLRVFESQSNSTDPAYRICAASLISIMPYMSILVRDKPRRLRLLSKSAAIRVELAKRRDHSKIIKFFLPILLHYDSNLKKYADVVDMLPDDEPRAVGDGPLLEILTWNYQKLLGGKHLQKTSVDSGLFEKNVSKLLVLAYDESREVRTRARVILTLFAPLRLFNAIAAEIGQNELPRPEDYSHIANLVPIVDVKLADYDEAQVALYEKNRELALDCFFARILKISTALRETVWARLLAHDPMTLADYLVKINANIFNDTEQNALQQLRFLGHLRAEEVMNDDAPRQDKLAKAVAAWVSRKSLPVRRQVAAHLLATEPLLLALNHLPSLKGLALEEAKNAEYLIDTYMSCLERIEKNVKEEEKYSPEVIKQFGPHPYQFLNFGVIRPELKIKSKTAKFLESRDPDLLVTMLAAYMDKGGSNQPATKQAEFALLGDMATTYQGALDAVTKRAVLAALRTGIGPSEEEQSLLCCRYLLDLGGSIPAKDMDKLPVAVRALLRLVLKPKQKKE